MFFFMFGNGTSGIVAQQIRAARALLGISAEELARLASVGVATVRRAELAQDKPTITDANLISIRRALEDAGIAFIDGDEAAGPGVRLVEPSPPQMLDPFAGTGSSLIVGNPPFSGSAPRFSKGPRKKD